MIYQNYFVAEYPAFVYQKHGKSWVKKKKKSKEKWVVAPFNEQMLLEHKYGSKILGKYSLLVRFTVLTTVLYITYKGFQYYKGQSSST